MEGNRDTEDTSTMNTKERLKANRQAGRALRLNFDFSLSGIISRSINTIFEHLRKINADYAVKVSHLELYNEELCDLLNSENKLRIFEDSASKSKETIVVRGLTEVDVSNPRDVFNVLEKSWAERRIESTDLNDKSRFVFVLFIYD